MYSTVSSIILSWLAFEIPEKVLYVKRDDPV